tara:strand:+ start:51 stop:737 length:687 start_codon:yes stop_codon:yes gene_type:complete
LKKNSLSHIAFILDGNQRWAKNNKLNNIEGYKKGFENIKIIINYCLINNINSLTLFTLSSENFRRPSIKLIYDIIYNNFNSLIKELVNSKKVKIKIFGSRENLPKKIIEMFNNAEELSSENSRLNLNIAFNYGFKDEIKQVLRKYRDNINKINIENTPEINKLFLLGEINDPEILIRTGGHKRLSNFIMYNLTYTELFFVDTLWPEFKLDELEFIINDYLNIDRKYGL